MYYVVDADASKRAVEILRDLNKLLSDEPQDVQRAVWALLSMARGPDSDEDNNRFPNLKLRTTGIVRREILSFIGFYGEVATPEDEPLWDIYKLPVSSHFAFHALDAIEVLRAAECLSQKEST